MKLLVTVAALFVGLLSFLPGTEAVTIGRPPGTGENNRKFEEFIKIF